MAACGWRALIARMASPLSGMATSDHSCRGDAPLGFGSTVTIFHPVVMRLRLPSSFLCQLIRQPARDGPVYRTRPLGARPMVLGVDLNYSEFATRCARCNCLFKPPSNRSDMATRPLTVVVLAAGGPSDVAGRIIAQHLSELLGQQVVVEHPSGALSSDAASSSRCSVARRRGRSARGRRRRR
jgi:hypothetical protein